MKEEELNDLKYRQLQKLAKDHGIKANLPKAALVQELLKTTEKSETDTVEHIAAETSSSDKTETKEIEAEKARRSGRKSDIVQEVTESESNAGSRHGSKRKSKNNENEVPNDAKTAKTSIDKVDIVTEKKAEIDEPVNNAGSRRGSKRKSRNDENEDQIDAKPDKRSFDKSAIEAEVAKLEDMTNKILEQPRKRSRNSSSMLRASAQVDTSTGSRRASRLSFFDKEAFDVEAAKVSNYAQNILNSPRRSSILNNSRLNSSILNLTPSKSIRESPLVKTETKPKTAKKVTLNTGIPRPRKVPDFAKLHAKQFGKMDTLDTYLEKKEKRMAALTPGAKKSQGGRSTPEIA